MTCTAGGLHTKVSPYVEANRALIGHSHLLLRLSSSCGGQGSAALRNNAMVMFDSAPQTWLALLEIKVGIALAPDMKSPIFSIFCLAPAEQSSNSPLLPCLATKPPG